MELQSNDLQDLIKQIALFQEEINQLQKIKKNIEKNGNDCEDLIKQKNEQQQKSIELAKIIKQKLDNKQLKAQNKIQMKRMNINFNKNLNQLLLEYNKDQKQWDQEQQMPVEQQKAIFQSRKSKSIKLEELQFIDYDTIQEERCKELLVMSQQITELKSLMKDVDEIVDKQGEQIDEVIVEVEETHQNTHLTNIQLLQAQKYNSKYRQKLLYLFFLLSLVGTVVLLAVLL